MNLRKQNGDIAIRFFRNVRATNKGEHRPISPILPLKIGCHGNSLERSKKEGEILNLRSNIYHNVTMW